MKKDTQIHDDVLEKADTTQIHFDWIIMIHQLKAVGGFVRLGNQLTKNKLKIENPNLFTLKKRDVLESLTQ